MSPLALPRFSASGSLKIPVRRGLESAGGGRRNAPSLYEVQTRTGTGNWATVVYSSAARSIVLPGQTSGTAVNVRVRALGGLTGYSAWSLDVTRYVS